MQDIEYLIKTTLQYLEGGRSVVMASIVSLQGSSPRHIGTRMIVGQDGKAYGTIGGSLLEFSTIKASRQVLSQKVSHLVDFDMVGQGTNAPGMICGGKARILLEYIPDNPQNREFIRNWITLIEGGQNHYLITGFKTDPESVQIVGRSILSTNGQVYHSFLKSEEYTAIRGETKMMSGTTILESGDLNLVVDPIRRIKTVYIFGAGHVALPTAKIAALTGFRVVVTDDRAEFASEERFPEAQEVRVIADFNQAFAGLTIDSDDYIVIVTRGHQFDREVLEGALKTGAGYIGMIASRPKREAIYGALLKGGATREQLEKVHSPIGIPIGGETPEEIAVSIIAEMISIRSQQQGIQ